MPLVAIVGRPNVGKSTLFNRIVGRRDAIVHDLPGVTRDRHYASAEWGGQDFTIVDTGGFVPASDDIVETAIREQATVAIEEADSILFVVDAETGLLPVDRDIADILRRAEKGVVLVVNKVDSENREGTLGEFFALGLGDPVPASALAGRKIGDLLDRIIAGFPASQAEVRDDPRLKIAVIGRPNVGKSSFVNALLRTPRHMVTPLPGTTRDPIDTLLRYQGEDILLIDTAGLRRRSRIRESIEFFSAVRTLKSIDRCDVAAVLLDAVQGLEHQDLRIVETAVARKRGTVLVVNKWDQVEKDSRTADAYKKALDDRLRMYAFLPVVFISALTGQRVQKVIDEARTVRDNLERRIPTGELNAALREDIMRQSPRTRSGKEVRIKYVSQVRTRPPLFAFFCNDPSLVTENYRRYLENRLRERYGFQGVPLSLSFKRKSQ